MMKYGEGFITVEVTGRKSQNEIGRCKVLHRMTLILKMPRLFRSGTDLLGGAVENLCGLL